MKPSTFNYVPNITSLETALNSHQQLCVQSILTDSEQFMNMGILADKVHKQGVHIPQHCYISHNHMHPYVRSSDMLGGTICMVV